MMLLALRDAWPNATFELDASGRVFGDIDGVTVTVERLPGNRYLATVGPDKAEGRGPTAVAALVDAHRRSL